ncbi:hypothetical protein Dfri01_68880 [Dyadobacter frigoris]|nr:hypothetical protein Dfri01_68880 [Dyadobacter frigoris]
MDLAPDADKSELYKWLLVDKDTLEVTMLTFLALDSSTLSEERFFKQGYLSFDSERAVFIQESSSEQQILEPIPIDELPDPLQVAIINFLLK